MPLEGHGFEHVIMFRVRFRKLVSISGGVGILYLNVPRSHGITCHSWRLSEAVLLLLRCLFGRPEKPDDRTVWNKNHNTW